MHPYIPCNTISNSQIWKLFKCPSIDTRKMNFKFRFLDSSAFQNNVGAPVPCPVLCHEGPSAHVCRHPRLLVQALYTSPKIDIPDYCLTSRSLHTCTGQLSEGLDQERGSCKCYKSAWNTLAWDSPVSRAWPTLRQEFWASRFLRIKDGHSGTKMLFPAI